MNLTIIILSILVIIAIIITLIIKNKYEKNKFKISIKESLDLTSLPIITFVSGDKKLNFLLDTGSNSSHIDSTVLKSNNIEYTITDNANTVIGLEGRERKVESCILTVKYKETYFTDEFCVTDLSGAFDAIKSTYGVQIHGIIGSEFFQKYQYVIDFKKLMCYIK